MVAQPCLRKGSMRLRSALMGTMRRGSCSSNSGIRRSAYRYVIKKENTPCRGQQAECGTAEDAADIDAWNQLS